MDAWKINFLLGPGLFSGALAVSFRECALYVFSLSPNQATLNQIQVLHRSDGIEVGYGGCKGESRE